MEQSWLIREKEKTPYDDTDYKLITPKVHRDDSLVECCLHCRKFDDLFSVICENIIAYACSTTVDE